MEFKHLDKGLDNLSPDISSETKANIQLDLELIRALEERNRSLDLSDALVLVPKETIENLISRFDDMDPPICEWDRGSFRQTSEYERVESIIDSLRGAMEIFDNEFKV